MNETIYKNCPLCTKNMELHLLMHKSIYINVCFECKKLFEIKEYIKQEED